METGSNVSIPETSTRQLLRTALRIVLAAVLLFVLLQFIQLDQISLAFRQARGEYITAAAALLAFNLGLQLLKWHYLLRTSGFTFSWKSIVQSFFFGLTVGTLTPGQLGELGGRGFHLSSQVPETIIGLTIFDKLQMFAVMMIGGGISIAILFQLPAILLFVVFLAAVLVFLAMVLPQHLAVLLRKTGLGALQNKWVQGFLSVLQSTRNARVISVTVVLTLLFYATIWLQLHLLLNAFSAVSFLDSFLGFASMMLAKSALPITFADLGTRELGLVFFLALRAVPEATAFNAGILLFAINVLTPSLIGLLFIPRSFSLRPTS